MAVLAAASWGCLPAVAVGGLPDGRGYELIDPAAPEPDAIGAAAISDDGERVTFLQKQYSPMLMTAVRTSAGWRSSSMLPPADQLLNGAYGTGVYAFTRDRSKAIVGVYRGLVASGDSAEPATLVRLDASGHQTVLFAPVPQMFHVLVSDDGEHVVARKTSQSDGLVYDLAQPEPVLLSVLPDGSVPACGVAFASEGRHSNAMQYWVSSDGLRVFFLASPDCAGGAPFELYVRDVPSETTTLISAPAVGGPEAEATFLQANRAGSAVVYMTASALAEEDVNTDRDIYRWSAATGNECLTCVVADADVKSATAGPELSAVVSEDLSHAYFVSERQLAPGASAGGENLYVWHVVGGQARIDFVAPFAFGSRSFLTPDPRLDGTRTPDGRTLIFASRATALDALTGRGNGGFLQYYRYSEAEGSLTCVSCPSTGLPTADVPDRMGTAATLGAERLFDLIRVLSDDGRRVFFGSADALVPEDTNGGVDIYEWHDGQVGLITDGVSDPGEGSHVLWDVSADGRDVLFSAFTALTPDAVDGSMHLYDARIGGGFDIGTKRSCEGRACQGPGLLAPSLETAGSVSFDEAARPAARSSRVRVLRSRSHGRAILLRIRVPGAGRLSVLGRRVKPVQRSVSGAAVVVVRVRLTAAAARALRKHRGIVGLRVRFVAVRGASSSARVRVRVGGS